MMFYAGIYLLSVFLAAVSQVILKKAAMKSYDSVVAEYLNPPVIFAYAIFFLTTLMTVYSYKEVPLSLGPILEATSYLYVTAFGAIIFKERITVKKVVALTLIIVGLVLYSIGLPG